MRVKTWKREVAFCILCWLVYLSVFGSLEALALVVWPSFLFITGAFGLDEINKNSGGSRIANLGGMFKSKSS